MSRVVAVCQPTSDAGFGERVRHVVAQDRWDLDSPEGIALMQAILRETYPMATVVGHDGVWSGGQRRTVIVDVWRDGLTTDVDSVTRWANAVYDQGAGAAYRAALRIVGDTGTAAAILEDAFREVIRQEPRPSSVEDAVRHFEASVVRLANAIRGSTPTQDQRPERLADPALTGSTLRLGAARAPLSRDAVDSLLSRQREALELAVVEDLKVPAIADRLRTTPSVVHTLLKEALEAVRSGSRPSRATALARWREAQRAWGQLPSGHRERQQGALTVAHTWLDYQVASGAIPPRTVVLVTDADRRFVATSANAAQTFGRASMIGPYIDDVTPGYARPMVQELWDLFDSSGSMHGDYDCDRPGQSPIRIPFRGIWGRPIPDLQVGYLQAPGVPIDQPLAHS